MAAVRGRKRTEDPTPNRARDIQRAFRARRAQHLESLEDRIHELEEENNYFRALLNLPTSNRPILGKGPTGRGLAKSRSRLSVETFQQMHDSPTPPSDTPTTPTMECPIPLPAVPTDPYVQMGMNMGREGDVEYCPPAPQGNGTGQNINNPFVFPQEKMSHPPQPSMDQFGFDPMSRSNSIDLSMGGLPSEFEAVSISGGIDGSMTGAGLYPDISWSGHPAMPMHSPDMQQTPINPRGAFSFTQQTAAVSMVPRGVPTHMRPVQGHRRCNTEPQSLGSLVAQGFNPGHRASSSEIVASGSPSPPPLPIRAPYQVHYQ